MSDFYVDALERAEVMIRELEIETAECKRVINLFLDISPNFRNADLRCVRSMAVEELDNKRSLPAVVLAARLILGETLTDDSASTKASRH